MKDINTYKFEREEEAIELLDILENNYVTKDEQNLITEKIEECLDEIQLCQLIEEQTPPPEPPPPLLPPPPPPPPPRPQEAIYWIQQYGGPQSVNYKDPSQLVRGAIVGQYESEDTAHQLQKLLQEEGFKATIKDSMYGRKRTVALVLD